MPPDQVPLVVDGFKKDQPVIMAYLLAVEEEVYDENEREALFYLGLVVWQIMGQSSRPLRQVTGERLASIEDENYVFLEVLASDTEADFLSATRGMIENYPEPEVLRYIIEAVMEEEPEDPGFREDVRGLAFIQLKIVLDALVASQDGPA
jgi:hypothetical protein